MRLLIIQPSHYRARSNQTLHKTRKRSLVGLTLPYLAALTPSEWDVELIDEQLVDIDFNLAVDLVAITTWTINSLRAYEIADRFRKRGIPVIMGGPHTYFYHEEAAEHCDAVGIGEGEETWPRMLQDAASGRLRRTYRASRPHNLENLAFPRYDLVDLRRYGLFTTFSIQSSRGCPFKCDFCSERFYLGQRYRCRPVQDVIEEIKHSKAKNLFFADSMFAGQKSHTMELMEALIPLRVRWSALWSAHLCSDQKFLDLAKRSGLLHLNIGLESLDQHTLTKMNKGINKVCQYEEILANLRKIGISYSVNLVFGFDTQKEDVFETTMSFLKKNKVPVAYFYILSPHRGTPLYEHMKHDNRIIDADHIRRWPGNTCYIKPRHFSAKKLEKNVKNMYREFYSYPSMLARLPLPVTKANMASLALNLSQRRMSRAEMPIQNFDYY